MSNNESRSILKHFVVNKRSHMKEMMGILLVTQLVSSPRYSHTHTALPVLTFLMKNKTSVVPQPQYSPGLIIKR